jgi:hypothetical protein
VGKTVLLNVIRDEAAAAIFMVDLIEAPEGSPLAPLIIPSLRKTLLRMSVQSTGFWSLPCRCSMSS